MSYRLLADVVAVVHAAFILFVVLGGLLALRWPRAAWIHLPAAAWGVLIEFGGWICPLTPLENRLRAMGGAEGYGGSFIGNYVLPLVYPAGLTREVQIVLGLLVLAINAAVYGWIWRRRRLGPRAGAPPGRPQSGAG